MVHHGGSVDKTQHQTHASIYPTYRRWDTWYLATCISTGTFSGSGRRRDTRRPSQKLHCPLLLGRDESPRNMGSQTACAARDTWRVSANSDGNAGNPYWRAYAAVVPPDAPAGDHSLHAPQQFRTWQGDVLESDGPCSTPSGHGCEPATFAT